MNFLAHLYFADDSAESMIGNLLPDFVRGPKRGVYPPAVWRGIERHRMVDRFIDTHPIAWRSRGRVGDEHRRFSGVLVDVFYDHVLAIDWQQYHAEPLEAFIAHVYRAIRSRPDLLGDAMTGPVDRMIADDWLGAYASVDGIARVLGMMSQRITRRVRRDVDLAPAAELLRTEADAWREDFHEFFPQLRKWLASSETTDQHEPF